jgi:hypothetical protein
MISPSYNIRQFLTAVQGKSYAELLAAADRECAAVEAQAYGGRAGSVRAREQGAGEYAHDLKGFLFWLRYGRRPDGVDDSTFRLFRPICEHLVQTGQLEAPALQVFNMTPGAEG